MSPPRDPRKLLWVAVRYLGGPEGEWELTTRGQRWRVCPHTDAREMLQAINGAFRVYR